VFREAGLATPELDARVLLCHAAGLSHEAYIAKASEKLQPEAAQRLDEAMARRLKREPLARILGSREFYGREFGVGPEALDPRPDTETLIEAALTIIEEQRWRKKPLRLLDLGTGTGCILVSLLAELPHAKGIGTDKSLNALTLAASNAERLGVGSRAAFLAADWLDGIEGKFDLIVSNPPYLAGSEIETLDEDVALYDPMLALYGGPDGLNAYRRIAAGVRGALADEGRLLVEIGASQGKAVAKIFRDAGLKVEAFRPDLAGRPRVVVAAR
jgi:release factor glutamine methyltransferase